MSFALKIMISIIWDFLDFTIGRIPVLGTIFDMFGTFFAILLWGAPGVIALWEIIDITDQLDAQIPSLTLIGILSYVGGRR